MQHVKISISQPEGEQREMLIALLADNGFEGFEENEDSLSAYISKDQYDEDITTRLLSSIVPGFTKEIIEPQNWNEMWESSFQPVVVDGFCTIKAHFHSQDVNTPYTIVITPKMSFGTGHHATTQLMMMAMRHIPFGGKSVLDFGTGTGVLAIIAAMLGATNITAIDNDEWSVENATENAARNRTSNIDISLGSIENLIPRNYDVILANINRHILLAYMNMMFEQLAHNGILLMSGLLLEDEEIIKIAATDAGFAIENVSTLNGWISIQATKK